MSTIRRELINSVAHRAYTLVDRNIHDDIHKQHDFKIETVLADKSLTEDERTEVVRLIDRSYDRFKVFYNDGTKRTCENCNQECLATFYCEHCVRNYLKANFSNWTSGNDDIDKLIQNCQIETLRPNVIIEWIPYNKLQNIKYLTKGGFSEIYTADWIDGGYEKWDSKERQLKRLGTHEVILKKLENVESTKQSWFEEVKSHLTISNKWAEVVKCYGLTQDPSIANYMLVMIRRDINLRNYLQQNHDKLTWKDKIKITFAIINALDIIHKENAVHRDLHSGNILFSKLDDYWYISDLGFCGPADKSSTSLYGNLPYIAPEVITGREYTFKADIYSIAMLMWEISSGKSPFINYKYSDYDLAMDIVNGMRPKIVSGIPSEYKSLLVQCWNADPLKRPDVATLYSKISKIHISYQNITNESGINNNLEINKANSSLEPIYSSGRLITSKIHQFENMPEPSNATEEEQEVFHSKLYDFNIPDNIKDFDKSNNQNNSTLETCNAFEDNSSSSKELAKLFKKLPINSKNDIQNNCKRETKEILYQHVKRQKIDIYNDEDEVCNNPNLHSEEQDELEIPDNGF